MTTSATDPPSEAPGAGLVEALHVSGPAPQHHDKLMLFGRFVGSWTIRWSSGSQQATGGLHFGTWNLDEEMHATRIRGAGPG